MPLKRPALLIAAVTGRAIAQSARRAGFVPLVADFFADLDTQGAAHACRKLEGDIARGIEWPSLSRALEALAAEVLVESFDKGEILFHRGDTAEAFFFVESGQVELSLISRDGQKKIVEVIAHGRTFAEAIIFMGEGKFPVTSEALSDSVVYRIPNGAYRS